MHTLRKGILILLLLSPALLVVGMRVAWWFVPKKPMSVLVVDKTGLTPNGQLKPPLFWVFNNERIVPRHGQIADAIYYIGTSEQPANEARSENDFRFLQKMKANRKLLIAEFVTTTAPSKAKVRQLVEILMGIRQTGWIGHYFANLDSTSVELPHWLVENYTKQHGGKWPFKHAGIVLAHENGDVDVLDSKTDLKQAEPLIHVSDYGVDSLGMAKKIPFTGWFDIVQLTDTGNHALSTYELRVNERGQALLHKQGIPTHFPAVVMHKTSESEYYYFCGNFSDMKIPSNSSYFVGGQHLALMLDGGIRSQFFYTFYQPMLSAIVTRYYKTTTL